MRELEQTLHDGLARLADEVDTTVPLAQRVRAARRRHARRAVGALVAAVLLLAVGTGLVVRGSGPGAVAPTDHGPGTGHGSERLEVWRDVGVLVPATWGWGGAPGACGVGETVAPDGHRLGRDEVRAGYVGRPIAQGSACASATAPSTVPYVWLGADVPTGTVDLGDGFVQQTRRVGDVTVTVASGDASQRRRILASAHRVSAGPCAASLSSPPTASPELSGSSGSSASFTPISMTVCGYAAAPRGASYELLYREELPMGPAKELVDAVAAAKPMGEFSCYGASGGEWALLHVAGTGGHGRDYVVDLSCPSIADPSGRQHRLTPSDVVPWAVDGINAVLHGSPLIDVPGRLIAP
jgi:hypothetical protein